MAPTEVVVILNKPTPTTKLGFIIESDYEGDDGHPRVGMIQPGTAANDVLVQGDIILTINDEPVVSHKDAARVIKAVQTGDIVLKVLANKPRASAVSHTAEAQAADAEREAAIKVQATVRGQQSRKSSAESVGDNEQKPEESPVKAVESFGSTALSGTKDFFSNLKGNAKNLLEQLPASHPKTAEGANGASADGAAMTTAASATADELEAATKMQATVRGQQSRKAMAGGKQSDKDKPKDDSNGFGDTLKGMLQRTGTALAEPFALCTSPRKSMQPSTIDTTKGLPTITA